MSSVSSRRGFLGTLAAGAAALVLTDPERLLWSPGKRKVFIPARGRVQQIGIVIAPGDVSGMTGRQIHERYITPAIASLCSRWDDDFSRNYRSVQLPAPKAVLSSGNYHITDYLNSRTRHVRHVTAYDTHSGQLVHRLDMMAVPCGAVA